MARRRHTLALILISLPILATVITAFRVRDLPKGLQESLRTDKKKCIGVVCDDNEAKAASVKIESAKRKYEDLKNVVREKQQELKQKTQDTKQSFKFTGDSADDDDDDDVTDFVKSESDAKHRVGQKSREGLKSEGAVKKPVDDSDEDENSEDIKKQNTVKVKKIDDKQSTVNDIKPKKTILPPKSVDNKAEVVQSTKKLDKSTLKKVDMKLKQDAKSEIPVKIVKDSYKSGDDDEDEDEDDDDDIDLSKINPSSKISDAKKQTKVQNTVSQSDESKDDDDDDVPHKKIEVKKTLDSQKKPSTKPPSFKKAKGVNDNDDDDSDESKNQAKKIDIKKKKTEDDKHDKVKPLPQKSKLTKSDEDDDDDDDDDDDHDIIISIGKPKPIAEKIPPQKRDEKESKKDDKVNRKSEPKPKVDVKKETNKFEQPKERKQTVKLESDAKKSSEQQKVKTPVKQEDASQKEVKKQKEDSKKESPKPKQQEKKPEESKKPEKKPESKSPSKESKPDKDHKKESSSVEMLIDSQEVFSKTASHLKNVNDALQRRNLLQSEFEDFYAFFPTFAPNFSRIHNSECRRHGQIMLRQLRGSKLWALNMLDATAKIPSGLLQGNGIQLGDFDQCLMSRARVQLDTGSVVKLQGQYCLARLDLKAEDAEMEVPVHLAQAKNLIKSRIDDPGHFVPRFSTLSWGVCVPSACGPEDVEVIIKDAIKHYQHKSGIVIRVKVDEDDCHVEEGDDWWEEWLEQSTVLTLSLYGFILTLVLVATIQDYLSRNKTEEQTDGGEERDEKAECDQKENGERKAGKGSDGFLHNFSLYYTCSKLTAPGTDDEISCIHGVRGIATLALLVAHKFLPIAVMPYTNRLRITEIVSSPLWSWCRAGWVYTDCFLLLSGTLTAHRIVSDSETSAPKRLFQRYLRLTPALLAVVLFYAYVWDHLSSGPMWGTLVTKNAEVCQEGWWWNLFYVQNYFGFEDMCAPQTHQLALDFQLTILGCLIIWGVQVKEGLSRIVFPVLHILAVYSRYTTARDHRLTLIAYHGVTVSQLYRTARLSYTSTLHRSTPYLVGLSLGLALQKPSQHGKIFLIFGWLVSSILWASVWWAGLDTGYTTYRYNTDFAAQYAALAPVASAVAIAWLIYAVHNGSSDGFLARFLCCRPLVLISRLSYALYLCQFIIFLSSAATVKTSTEFNLISLIDMQEISAILMSSVILTLTFIIPMQSLHKLLAFPLQRDKTVILEEHETMDDENNEGIINNKEIKVYNKELMELAKARELQEPLMEEPEIEEADEVEVVKPQNRRSHILVHREVLEEIPEVEVEYEAQRDKLEGLQEILEEEEEEDIELPEGEEMQNHIEEEEEDMEFVNEEEEGERVEDGFWRNRDADYVPGRVSYSRNENRDLDEWEWTTNGNGTSGAQHYRYTR